MLESNVTDELVIKVSEALQGRGPNVTDEQMQDVNWLTDQMNQLPQFVAYEEDAIRGAVKKAIKKV